MIPVRPGLANHAIPTRTPFCWIVVYRYHVMIVQTPAPPLPASVDAPAAQSRPPSLDRLLRLPQVNALVGQYGHEAVVAQLREMLAAMREALRGARSGAEAALSAEEAAQIADALAQRLARTAAASMREVFNLTGTVLHTNLGRALLPPEAARAAARALERPCNLEYDLDEGGRGERDSHVETLLCELTGAQAAIVVNNNAAAVFLLLNALAAGGEVPVSRGELIEIGGSFRIPDIMRHAGATLREIGTTNRTHLRDFEAAIGPDTRLLMKVHASNFAIVGFTTAVQEAELAALAHRHGLPFVSDLGSGSLVDLARWGLPPEPTPRATLDAGADLVTFSGDKLLGGPQAGLIVGRSDLVERLRRHPLKRALRVDKATLAALEAVLRLYRDPDTLAQRLPTLRLLTRPQEEIRACAQRMLARAQAWAGPQTLVEVADCSSQIGSGSLPVDRLPSAALRFTPVASRRALGTRLDQLAATLRALPIPVIGRVHADALWLDLRCLEDEERLASQFGLAC